MNPPRAVYASSGYADVFEGFLGALVPADSFPDEAWTGIARGAVNFVAGYVVSAHLEQ
jgi:hypothetical protein